jgi:hypothetical protein
LAGGGASVGTLSSESADTAHLPRQAFLALTLSPSLSCFLRFEGRPRRGAACTGGENPRSALGRGNKEFAWTSAKFKLEERRGVRGNNGSALSLSAVCLQTLLNIKDGGGGGSGGPGSAGVMDDARRLRNPPPFSSRMDIQPVWKCASMEKTMSTIDYVAGSAFFGVHTHFKLSS